MKDRKLENTEEKRTLEETRRAAARGYGRLSTMLLYFLGGYILLAPWIAPRLLGWEMITRVVGGEQVVLRIAVGILFVYFATLTSEKYALKFLTQDILHAFNMLLYGQDYRQHRQTVTTQIRRLRSDDPKVRASAHRVLKEMTGQPLPAEFEPWHAWWERARPTFRLARSEPGALGRPGSRKARTGETRIKEDRAENTPAKPRGENHD
jgi:hypothetical protein